MKRVFSFLILLLLSVLLVSGCAVAEEEPALDGSGFFDFFADERITSFAADFNANPPVSVTYVFNGEASGVPAAVSDKAEIAAVFEALSAITVTGESETSSTDNEHIFTFVMSDGDTVTFCFNGHLLEHGGKTYNLKNDDALWSTVRDLFE